jgi:hypothetical protein
VKTARLLATGAIASVVAGCSIGQGGREQLGDEAWHDARWADAVADYRAAGDSPRLLAKLADATLQGGLLTQSAEAWTRLGTDAPDRAAEAAAGLARVASAAEQAGNDAALAQAMAGLHRIAPGWPLQRVAARIGRVADLQPAAAADVIPALLSTSPGRAVAEPMLLALGRADRARGSCDVAVPILEGVLRTTTTAALRDSAATPLAWCELQLGLTALAAAHPGDAERWLDRAAQHDPNGAVARRARVAFGDALASEGDSAAARLAWQAVVTAPVPPDSLTQLAALRLQRPPAVVGDSGTVRPEHP